MAFGLVWIDSYLYYFHFQSTDPLIIFLVLKVTVVAIYIVALSKCSLLVKNSKAGVKLQGERDIYRESEMCDFDD